MRNKQTKVLKILFVLIAWAAFFYIVASLSTSGFIIAGICATFCSGMTIAAMADAGEFDKE